MDKAVKTFLNEPLHNRRVIRWLIAGFILMLSILLVQSIAMLVTASKDVVHRYFMITENGQVIEVMGQEAAAFNPKKRAGWLFSTIRDGMTFSFSNWENELPRAKEGFTPDAWDKLHQSMIDQGWWGRVVNEQTNLTTIPVAIPKFVAERSVNGILEWTYEVHLLHEWEGNGVRRSQRTRAEITLQEHHFSVAPAEMLISDIDLFGVLN